MVGRVQKIIVGVDKCPNCNGELAGHRFQSEEADFSNGAPEMKKKSAYGTYCFAGCGWVVVGGADDVVPEQDGLELPDCGGSHRPVWCKRRRVGRRIDMVCLHLNTRTIKVCGSEKSVSVGPPIGWKKKSAGANETKKLILAALSQYAERGLVLSDFRRLLPELTEGQIVGCLNRMVVAKTPLLEIAGTIFLPPHHKCKLYKITPTGKIWLQWAVNAGLFEEREAFNGAA